MEKQYLVPGIYDKFSCLGGECGYTCCQEWPIAITKQDYKELLKQRVSPGLKEKIRSFVGKVKDETFDEQQNYAFLRMGKDNKCPFLTEEGFCGLQIECGAQMLPSICQSFPRSMTYIVGGVYELSVRIACEAAVRLLVEETEPLQFDIRQDHTMLKNGAYVFYHKMPDYNPLLLHYWDIKALGIGILQNRFYTLPQRMLYLGFVLERLMEYETKGRLSEVGALLQGLMEQDDSETLRQSLEKLPSDHRTSAAAQFAVLAAKFSSGSTEVRELFLRAITTIGTYNEETSEGTIRPETYQEKRTQFDAFCEKYPHVMENIAVHQFYEVAMPFGGIYFGKSEEQKIDIWKNYLYFCWRTVALQFIMGALVGPDTPLNEVALMVSIIARLFPNKVEGAEDCVKKMEEAQMTTVERLSILLKG